MAAMEETRVPPLQYLEREVPVTVIAKVQAGERLAAEVQEESLVAVTERAGPGVPGVFT